MTSCKHILGIDIETYSSVDLPDCGVYRYVESPDFDVLIFGYCIDDEDPVVLDLTKQELPGEILAMLTDPDYLKIAFNANFERTCLTKYTGKYMDPEQWQCTMVQALELGLPGSLAAVGQVVRLPEDEKKLKTGKDLIRYFSTPCKPTKSNGGRTRNLPEHAPEKWDLYLTYNRNDVIAERAIRKRLDRFAIHPSEHDLWVIDQRINDRGVRIDRQLAVGAVEVDQAYKQMLTDRAKELTGLENPNSAVQIKKWLYEQSGLTFDSLGKGVIDDVREQLKGYPQCIELLDIRAGLAKTSVAKYSKMLDMICEDDHARGVTQFCGASRTGRWAGRGLQLQNLSKNKMDLGLIEAARDIVKTGDVETLEMLYKEDPSNILSQLVRTAFIPEPGEKFIVADFSAIEARVIAYLANEQWRIQSFIDGKDIYCASASQMFRVPVEKHGQNSHLRQKGKITELSCIAEGELVLTDKGLVPIQNVTLQHKLWDGEDWVEHDGLIYQGEKEVITYDGLTATPDHKVWVEGEEKPVYFGIAATFRSHLLRSKSSRESVRERLLKESREALERGEKSLLCTGAMHSMRELYMDCPGFSDGREISRMSELFTTEGIPEMARQEANGSQAEMHESERQGLQELRSTGNRIPVQQRLRSMPVREEYNGHTGQESGIGQNRLQWPLRTRESEVHISYGEQHEQAEHGSVGVRSSVLALCKICCHQETERRDDSGRDYRGRVACRREQAEELERNKRTARVYDIRNAGPNHRFTVSGVLVSNCGYGGSIGALKAFGADKMGLSDEELLSLVKSWREASPNIVNFWWELDRKVKDCIQTKRRQKMDHGLEIRMDGPFLRIRFASGREISYVRPKVNADGKITYEGTNQVTRKWEDIPTYGCKITENVVQGFARDCLANSMINLENAGYKIRFHVHDEVVISCPKDTPVATIEDIMSIPPTWAEGLPLRAAGYECDFYIKD